MTTDKLNEKYERLRQMIRGYRLLLVACSGGVDSALLVKVAHEVLGDRLLAVTAVGPIFPAREAAEAKALAVALGVRHLQVEVDMLAVEGFAGNPPERCYLCKRVLYGRLLEIARAEGLDRVADGAHADDPGQHRPGLKAARELGVVSPLIEAGLTKAEVRMLSKRLGLPTAELPSSACLASRVPYGEAITPAKLRMIDEAEQFVKGLGFAQVRVRHHGDVARIEVAADEIERLASKPVREQVVRGLAEIGYHYVALDCRGYRSGSMDEVLGDTPPTGH
jgi:uncharacterized protein